MIRAEGPAEERRRPEERLTVHEREWLGGALRRSVDAYVVPCLGQDPVMEFEVRWYMHDAPLDQHAYPGPLTSEDQLAMYACLLDGGHTEQSAAACLAAYKQIPLQRFLLPRTLYLQLDFSDDSLVTWARVAVREEREQQQRFVVTLHVMRIMLERLNEEVDARVGRLVRALGGVAPLPGCFFWRPGFFELPEPDAQQDQGAPQLRTRIVDEDFSTPAQMDAEWGVMIREEGLLLAMTLGRWFEQRARVLERETTPMDPRLVHRWTAGFVGNAVHALKGNISAMLAEALTAGAPALPELVVGLWRWAAHACERMLAASLLAASLLVMPQGVMDIMNDPNFVPTDAAAAGPAEAEGATAATGASASPPSPGY